MCLSIRLLLFYFCLGLKRLIACAAFKAVSIRRRAFEQQQQPALGGAAFYMGKRRHYPAHVVIDPSSDDKATGENVSLRGKRCLFVHCLPNFI